MRAMHSMLAMRLDTPHGPLQRHALPVPEPGPGEVLLRVQACGVCRTDLHLVDGELPDIVYPVIPGHEIVGRIVAMAPDVTTWRVGTRVGVPWLGGSCGQCQFCQSGRENLCGQASFTGYTRDGGYAGYVTARAAWCLPIPDRYADAEAAPLLCAGLIGYRAYRAAGVAPVIGLYGFGAAAHLLLPVALHEGRRVFALTRPGDQAAQDFARSLGAHWAGGSDETPPEALDAAILFAPAGELVPAALAAVRRGGRVVCAGIHMSDIPSFPYHLLWGERSIVSVANLTREDGMAFMRLAAQLDLRPAVTRFDLSQANQALDLLRAGRVSGACVLCNPA
jgi:alcohol dehydrogenase, propanol-preferring